ncbi:MAG: lysophospholipid acyltransferase family protein [Minicystis sp.]
MILERPAGRLLHAWFYTLYMSQKAMRAKASGASDARVCEYVQAWSRGLRDRVGIEVRAFGLESVDWSKTYVIMANHASYLDVLALYSTLPRIVGFIAKKELYLIPFFNGVMRAVGCVPVNRGKHKEAVEALREAADAVRAGTTIAVFPEGTRSRGDRIQPLKKGPFHLVQMAQVEILPIGIRGAAALMPRENTAIRPGVIEVHAGAPIAPPPPTDAEARKALMARVRAEIARLADVPVID